MSEAEHTVSWRSTPVEGIPDPVVRRVPYLELKLEHPELEPTGHDDRFFPDAVPYALEGEARVFYWRSVPRSSLAARDCRLACATTDGLATLSRLPTSVPSLTGRADGAETVVVDGTVAGETTRARVESYSPPDVRVEGVPGAAVELEVVDDACSIPVGERRRIELREQRIERPEQRAERPEQRAQSPDSPTRSTTLTPELVARYPGRRVLHHPAPGSDYRLFPRFGLDVDAIPNPLSVPTVAGELDHSALASQLGVELSDRPYPERVLWQAFAFEAFDPHADGVPEIAGLRTGHIALRVDGADGQSRP